MRGVAVFAWALALACSTAACGGDDAKPPAAVKPSDEDDGGMDDACIDADGDGYGKNCTKGKDCDDTDPKVTDQCRRCLVVAKDCPCKPGTTRLRCDPPVKHVAGGLLVCSEGTRYCRDGYWGDCETIGEYLFVPDP
jgi:hypothetical protein